MYKTTTDRHRVSLSEDSATKEVIDILCRRASRDMATIIKKTIISHEYLICNCGKSHEGIKGICQIDGAIFEAARRYCPLCANDINLY